MASPIMAFMLALQQRTVYQGSPVLARAFKDLFTDTGPCRVSVTRRGGRAPGLPVEIELKRCSDYKKAADWDYGIDHSTSFAGNPLSPISKIGKY